MLARFGWVEGMSHTYVGNARHGRHGQSQRLAALFTCATVAHSMWQSDSMMLHTVSALEWLRVLYVFSIYAGHCVCVQLHGSCHRCCRMHCVMHAPPQCMSLLWLLSPLWLGHCRSDRQSLRPAFAVLHSLQITQLW